jgi:hypothetical protein
MVLNYASHQLRMTVPLALFISAPIHGLDKSDSLDEAHCINGHQCNE